MYNYAQGCGGCDIGCNLCGACPRDFEALIIILVTLNGR